MSNAHSRIQHPLEEVALQGTERESSDEVSTASEDQPEIDRDWASHPINIRVSIPLIFGRWYFTIIGGPERRDRTRRAKERRKHPLFTLGNVIFMFIVGPPPACWKPRRPSAVSRPTGSCPSSAAPCKTTCERLRPTAPLQPS